MISEGSAVNSIKYSRIWLSPPDIQEDALNNVTDVFSSNWIAPVGPHINKFEENLAAVLGNNQYVAVLNSGTAAIHLALQACGVGPGDEVICQSFTFIATSNPILYLGARPIFVDSENSTWNICPQFLEEAITSRLKKGNKPKAIIAVHLYGMPYNVEAIRAIAEKYDIPVIEDAAEALGSTFKGKSCGSFGKYGILSFNGNKIITTGGGGAVIAKSLEEKNFFIYLATHAKEDFPYYQHSQIGYNYRLSNVSAAIGIGQLKYLDFFVAQKRELNTFYKEIFSNATDVSFQEEPSKDYYSNFWLTAIVFNKNAELSLKRITNAFNAHNIETRPLWKPLHLQPVYQDIPYFGSETALSLFNSGICLPSGTGLNAIEKERIQEVVFNLYK